MILVAKEPVVRLLAVFYLSGVAALIYQIAWQRVLFRIYGIDIASVTIVVTAFMLGLGLGSLLGGAMSRRRPRTALLQFAAFEGLIGGFGYFSLHLFDLVASGTSGLGHVGTGLVVFGLLVLPTLLMGATLPILVAHVTRQSGNVGRSVSALYFANTLGAASGAFLAAGYLLGHYGLLGSVRWAAVINLAMAASVWFIARGRSAVGTRDGSVVPVAEGVVGISGATS